MSNCARQNDAEREMSAIAPLLGTNLGSVGLTLSFFTNGVSSVVGEVIVLVGLAITLVGFGWGRRN